MKATKVTLIILSLLTLVIFLMINQSTVEPGSSSGNGNPLLLMTFVLVPILILMVICWVIIMRVHNLNRKNSIVILSISFIHIIGAFVYHRYSLNNYIEVIRNAIIERNGSVNSDYLNDITSIFSIHVNNQYFNVNTFLVFISISILIALIYHLWDLFDRRKNEVSE